MERQKRSRWESEPDFAARGNGSTQSGRLRRIFSSPFSCSSDFSKGRLLEKIMKAVWNGAVIAESDETVVVEGNHYFPPDSIQSQFLKPNESHTVCPWKGTASYYDL